MPLRVFELLSVVVLALAIGLGARRVGSRRFVIDYVTLAIAGYLGEATSIAWYRYYTYAWDWDLRVGAVPLLVPLIWPLVITSAREVRTALFPRVGAIAGALVVMALVIADASMVEVLAVRAGLWTWSEDGHLGVPILGILAWGYFAGAADWMMRRFTGRDRWLVVPGALTVAHALIVISWWGCFRWVLRGDLGIGGVAVVAFLGGLASALALVLRRRGRTIPMAIAAPRMLAATLFFALLVSIGLDVPLWIHVLSIAVPYALATEIPTRRSNRVYSAL